MIKIPFKPHNPQTGIVSALLLLVTQLQVPSDFVDTALWEKLMKYFCLRHPMYRGKSSPSHICSACCEIYSNVKKGEIAEGKEQPSDWFETLKKESDLAETDCFFPC